VQRAERKSNFGLAVTLLSIAALGRLIPHPPNFTPVGAMALYGGARLPKFQAIILVLLTMLVSDWLLARLMGVPSSGAVGVVVYLSLSATVFFGRWFQKRPGAPRFVIAILETSTLFFLATNFAVWLFEALYPKNLQGLLTCYAAAIPFYRNQLAGDLTWGGSLFLLDLLAGRLNIGLGQTRPRTVRS
jgi:hypothetical protein